MTTHPTPAGDDATTAPTAADAPRAHAEDHVMDLLHERVPLSLLVDLAEPGTPDSRAILEQEGAAEGRWWEPERS